MNDLTIMEKWVEQATLAIRQLMHACGKIAAQPDEKKRAAMAECALKIGAKVGIVK